MERRGFLGTVSAGMLILAGGSSVSEAMPVEPTVQEPWLEGLSGKHKQYLDVAAHGQGAPLGRTANLLNAYVESYGLKDSDVNVVFGAHGTAIAMVLDDALWSKYTLGSHFSIADPATKSPALRNIFAGVGKGQGGYTPALAELQKRGVRFIACRQAIARLSRELAARDGGDAALINKELLAGLLPGVTGVPAAIVAANRAQEAGLTYLYIG